MKNPNDKKQLNAHDDASNKLSSNPVEKHHIIINLVVLIEEEHTIVNILILSDIHNTHKLGKIVLRLIILLLAHHLLEEIMAYNILIGIQLLVGMLNLPILLQGIEIDVLINALLHTMLIVLYLYSSFCLFLVIKNWHKPHMLKLTLHSVNI